MRRNNFFITTIIAAGLLTACAHSVGTDFNVDNVSAIKIGSTTPSQTIAALGEPYSRNINTDSSEDWVYRRIDTKASMNAKAFVPFVGAYLKDSSSTKMDQKEIKLRFENGVLKQCEMKLSSSKGTGSAMSGGGVMEAATGGTIQNIACGQ